MPGASRRGEVTRQEELNYLVSWFTQFSDMQKSDFFKIILKKYAGNTVDANLIETALQDMKVSERPPTIFQCRMKLFDDWFANWSDEEKEDLLIRLKNLDSSFMEMFQKTLDGNPIEEDTFRQPILQLRPASEKSNNGELTTSASEKLQLKAQMNGNGHVTPANGINEDGDSEMTPSPVETEKTINGQTNETSEALIATPEQVLASTD